MSGRRTVIVGDVHGCIDELRELLEEVGLSGSDRLVSTGDLLGKGPDGAAVVRFFRDGGHEAVRGNHDEKVLRDRRERREGKAGRKPLHPSHRAHARALSDADWTWLEASPVWLELPEHGAIVVHGGLVPGVPLAEQDPRTCMNLRSIRPDGSPSKRVDEGEPWAKLWPGPELVVFGHDAIRGLQIWPHAVGLDSGCVYGGRLSALVLPGGTIVSVPAHRSYIGGDDPRLPHGPEQPPSGAGR